MSEDKWISVEDRLPPDCEDVLTVVIDGSTKTGYRIVKNFYLHGIYDWVFSHREVLFWQPLPELPKDLRNKE